ncbi:hypothetical protein CK500_05495 [Halorubrum salipaludis]|uniref:Uncharacterized protein n=1 Tax=Halorubrum salipaludis TaxID=2032630 RepID=A0A2A2FJU9_9EURY|nr:hypothetical protein CK500_05495 [Halorubrum salipaludis]
MLLLGFTRGDFELDSVERCNIGGEFFANAIERDRRLRAVCWIILPIKDESDRCYPAWPALGRPVSFPDIRAPN